MRKIAITFSLVAILAAPMSFAATRTTRPAQQQNQISRTISRLVKRFFSAISILGEIHPPIPEDTTLPSTTTTSDPTTITP